jgi:hypothetical protein
MLGSVLPHAGALKVSRLRETHRRRGVYHMAFGRRSLCQRRVGERADADEAAVRVMLHGRGEPRLLRKPPNHVNPEPERQPHVPPVHDHRVDLETVPTAPSPSTSRGGRALIGWMSPDAARAAMELLRGQADRPIDSVSRARAAREAVAARATLTPTVGAVHDPTESLAHYGDVLLQQPGVAQFVGDGWKVATVDMRHVCPLHPIVLIDGGSDRVSAAEADKIVSLATVSLPAPVPVDLPVQHDPVRQTFTISSPNPNLRILESSAGQSSLGTRGFAFQVGVTPSFVKVAQIRDRLILCDGHHRVLAFLRRNITTVPALVRSFDSIDELHVSAGMFSREVLLGDRPPTMVDYLDDAVSAEVTRPSTNKVIVIQALELAPLG